jgi:hypothetical protein
VQIKPVVEDETVLWSQEEDAGYQIPLIGLTTQGALIAFNQEGQGITILERRLSFDRKRVDCRDSSDGKQSFLRGWEVSGTGN